MTEDAKKELEEKPLVVRSADIFQGRRDIVIEHQGVRYRLRITKRGKLILHK